MMKGIKIVSTLSAGLIASVLCYAGPPKILPGLWEHKINMHSKNGHIEAAIEQAKAMLENLPADQRKMVEQMMAKKGIDPTSLNRTIKVCLTQEQINNFSFPESDDQCKQTFEEKSANQYKMTLNCPGNPATKGEGEFLIKDDKTYTGKVVMDVKMAGQSDTMTMEQQGRWLASDCGSTP